ncbi:hypothetical protein Hanom_Chr17g01574461 [Helianthus anomalus]
MVPDWGLLFRQWGGLFDSMGLFVFTGDRMKVVLGGPDGAHWCRWCPLVPMVPRGADGARIAG